MIEIPMAAALVNAISMNRGVKDSFDAFPSELFSR